MSEVERAATVDTVGRPQLFLRPNPLFSIIADTGLAAVIYLAAYWLRFQGDRLESFLPRTLSTLPLVVGAQVIALYALRAYVPRPRVDWLVRVVLGSFAGAAVSAALLSLTTGLAGTSRMVFAADALLLSIAAVRWRGAWVLRTRVRLACRPAPGRRAGTRRSFRGDDDARRGGRQPVRYRELLKNLVLKDLKLKYRGSVFGFVWSLANPLLMILVYAFAFTYVLRVRTERVHFLSHARATVLDVLRQLRLDGHRIDRRQLGSDQRPCVFPAPSCRSEPCCSTSRSTC